MKTKEEVKAYQKLWRAKHKEEIKQYQNVWRKINANKMADYGKNWRLQNKDKVEAYVLKTKDKRLEYSKYYEANCRKKNSEGRLQYYKKYYLEHKQAKLVANHIYQTNRAACDPLFKLKRIYRKRVQNAFKNVGWLKGSSISLLGCSWENAKLHLEKQFKEGMSWENHGLYGWHIDHIIPLASANTEDELIKLCHYTNLQPLWAIDNLKKSSSLVWRD